MDSFRTDTTSKLLSSLYGNPLGVYTGLSLVFPQSVKFSAMSAGMLWLCHFLGNKIFFIITYCHEKRLVMIPNQKMTINALFYFGLIGKKDLVPFL